MTAPSVCCSVAMCFWLLCYFLWAVWDWFWLRGRLINPVEICIRAAPIFWNFNTVTFGWATNEISKKNRKSKLVYCRLVYHRWLLSIYIHAIALDSMCSKVSFAEYRLFYRALLQKRPVILYAIALDSMCCLYICALSIYIYIYIRALSEYIYIYVYAYVYICAAYTYVLFLYIYIYIHIYTCSFRI